MGFFPHIPHWRWNDFLEMIKVVLHEAIPKRDYRLLIIYMYETFCTTIIVSVRRI
jgi:hypothetical protein